MSLSRSTERGGGSGLAAAAVAVVDPVSGGRFIAERLGERGIDGHAVLTGAGTPGRRPDGFAAVHAAGPDIGALAAALASAGVAAVIPGAESGVALADALAERLGLAGNPVATTARRRDKVAMAAAVREAGLPVAAQAECGDVESCLAWAGRTGYPVVVKPTRSSGSERVRVCPDAGALSAAARAILGVPDKYGNANATVLVQEYLDGPEYTVDAVCRDGRFAAWSVGAYTKIDRDGARLYDRIDFFAPDDPAVDPAIVSYAADVARAVDVRVGAVHAEVIRTARGPRLVEIAARAHGGIASGVIDAAFAPSFLDHLVGSYLGTPPPDRVEARHQAAICFLVARHGGRLRAIAGREEIEALPTARRAVWVAEPDRALAETVDLATCPALIELVADRRSAIDRDIARIRAMEAAGAVFELESAGA